MEKLFENESSLFQSRVNNIIEDSPSKKIIEDLIKLNLLKQASKDESQLFLSELYNLVGIEQFADIIELMAGRTVRFPEPEFFKITVNTAIAYYYKYLKNKNWNEIDAIVQDDELTHVKYGIRTNDLDHFIKDYKNRLIKEPHVDA